MKNKRIWFLIILLISFLIGISIWASFMEEEYEGKYYKYTKIYSEFDYTNFDDKEKYKIIKNNMEFDNYLKELNVNFNNIDINELKMYINEKFFEDKSLVIVNHYTNVENVDYNLKSVIIENDNVKINLKDYCPENLGYMLIVDGVIEFAIPINSKDINKVEINISQTDVYDVVSEICKNVVIILIFIIVSYISIKLLYRKTNSKLKTTIIFIILVLASVCIIYKCYEYYEYYFVYRDTVDKPIIYLYPKEETEVDVKVMYPDKLTCTYPKYEEGWNVLAKPSGELKDLKTGRELYGLYYEGLNTNETSKNEGFVVRGEDTITFLEDKLKILGLTEREANEFIIYWLPKLEKNEYNFIKFQTIEEINKNMPLEIKPTPDTIIRIMMEYKPLKHYKEIKGQTLTTPIREGFTVVEWGGTEIK